ncbi:hypothetical protein ACSQ67_010405 [Phaseolus vulgaris]
MISSSKLKSVDFYRKIPRDLTEASLSGAGLSIVAALCMVFLFGMELNSYLSVSTATSVIVDKSSDGDYLRIDFNMSFPALSCEFAAVDVSDVLGTNRLNLTKTIRKFSIDSNLRSTEAYMIWHSKVRPSWEKASKIIKERYDPETDGRIVMGRVDCTQNGELCRRTDHGHHDHESYYGDRDTDSLVKTMDNLVASLPTESQKSHSGDKSNLASHIKRPAPSSGGCRIEGYVRVKKVPGNLIISARSDAHSFDASQMNMSHVVNHLSFGRKVSPRVMSDVKRLIPYVGSSHDRLNGLSFINTRDFGANVTMEHYLQIVKTEVITRKDHKLVEEYEYTAHSSVAQSLHIPVAKFHLELSPMQVLITENPKSFSHFITNVCAIIGGVFTVAGILDSILHNTIRLMKKVELGKNF